VVDHVVFAQHPEQHPYCRAPQVRGRNARRATIGGRREYVNRPW
jgi:hypothetical protein